MYADDATQKNKGNREDFFYKIHWNRILMMNFILNNWFKLNGLSLNADKTKLMIFRKIRSVISFKILII